jgi:hypothetical protein
VTDRYPWDGREEYILRYGNKHKAQIILLQPFFEEANRFRQILVSVMRELAAQGIGCALPDLPGTGESLMDTREITLDKWRGAVSAVQTTVRTPNTKLLVASFRGAALIDDAVDADHVWRFAPEAGQRLIRDLRRTQLTSGAGDAPAGCETVAGNVVQTDFLDALAGLSPAPAKSLRTVRLDTDAAQADEKLPGTPVWRRSEPGDDPALRAALITDLRTWASACAVF